MRIAIRVDASTRIGMGHVMRCVTLAEELIKQSAEVVFICRSQSGDCIDWIRDRGFTVLELSLTAEMSLYNQFMMKDAVSTQQLLHANAPFEWLIVDHYEIDYRWEGLMRGYVRQIMVIDDLANRRHDCDLLLDQNYYKNSRQRYLGLLPPSCTSLLGPSYVLLRKEFVDAKKKLLLRDGTIKRILVFFGSSDPSNETSKVLIAIKELALNTVEVDVVVGVSNPHRHQIKMLCNNISNVNYYCNISNMAELILRADIGIGAGGSSIWERCYLGLPSITSVVAPNQIETTEYVASLGAVDCLGSIEILNSENYISALMCAISNPMRVKNMSDVALGLVSRVGTSAVVEVMLKFTKAATSYKHS
jgi:UDP-2,4-diacetamido-2,4,6-trideoxy-beta-L-altropyranose hydrolase